MKRPSAVNLCWLALYGLVLLGVFFAMRHARSRAIHRLDTENAQLSWDDWRAEAARHSKGEGPVLRRIPKSEEPPELVLLRDYFGVSFLGVALLTTTLFITAMYFIRGVSRGNRFPLEDGT